MTLRDCVARVYHLERKYGSKCILEPIDYEFADTILAMFDVWLRLTNELQKPLVGGDGYPEP